MNNPWVWILIFIAVICVGCFVVSLIISLCVTLTSRSYSTKTFDKYIKEIEDKLPCTDCKDCGCEDCHQFASLFLFEQIAESKCPHIEEYTIDQITDIKNRLLKIMEDPRPVKKRRIKFFDIKDPDIPMKNQDV